jgi:hypothetical protein
MGDASSVHPTPEVPKQVFERFLATLTAGGQPPELVARLHKTLVEDGSYGERALRAALFSDEQAT